jgi:hypothetical protein
MIMIPKLLWHSLTDIVSGCSDAVNRQPREWPACEEAKADVERGPH